MRLAICQVDTKIGAFIHNVDKVLAFVRQAAAQKTDLAIFPELSLSSYPPLDLLDRPGFAAANARALDNLIEALGKIDGAPSAIALGCIMPNASPEGRAICNTAVVLYRAPGARAHAVAHVQQKRLLPTYDVFDEVRYFEPGRETTLWQSPWGKIGFCVCEDSWYEETHAGRRLYKIDPARDLKGAALVVNLSASPFEMNKRLRRQQMIADFVSRIGAPLAYVNMVGANDEILFDGASMFYSSRAEVLYELPSFREAIAVLDVELASETRVTEVAAEQPTEDGKSWEKMFAPTQRRKAAEKAVIDAAAGPTGPALTASSSNDNELLHKAIVTGIRDYFRKTGFKKAVLGLSGGIDSAVVACLAAEALGPRNVLGVSIPSHFSSRGSLVDAEELARAVGIEYRVLSLKFILTTLLMELKPAFGGLPPDVTEENIQARMRGVMLMALANKRGALLLTTGNKSELGVGYCTTYGDMAGALAPVGDVYKMRVYGLARFINARNKWIPQSSIDKPPSAELRPDQTDQDTLPPYDVLDRILELHFEGLAGAAEIAATGLDRATVDKVLHLVQISEFKRRQAAPALKVTSKAFGLGRRIPVAKGYEDATR